MRLKFEYQMAVYDLYEYGDVHVYENCYCVSSFRSVSGFYLLSFFFLSFLSSFFLFCLLSFLLSFYLSFVLSFVFAILHTSAISCTRLKFDYQVAVYEHYVYGDVHIMNYYCVSSFLSVTGFYRQVRYLA